MSDESNQRSGSGDPGAASGIASGLARRVRLLAARRLPPATAREVARRVLEEAERDLAAGRLSGGDELARELYERTRAAIAEADSETSDTPTLPEVRRGDAAVIDALEGLEAGDREILRLAYHRGLAPSEIAEELDEPVERVRERLRNALARFDERRRA